MHLPTITTCTFYICTFIKTYQEVFFTIFTSLISMRLVLICFVAMVNIFLHFTFESLKLCICVCFEESKGFAWLWTWRRHSMYIVLSEGAPLSRLTKFIVYGRWSGLHRVCSWLKAISTNNIHEQYPRKISTNNIHEQFSRTISTLKATYKSSTMEYTNYN